MINKKINYLLIKERIENDKYGNIQYLCLCDCGKEKITTKQRIIRGETKSCGCLLLSIRHGKSNHKLYSVWSGMKKRCNSKKAHNYELYGGRGISVCTEWSKSFIEFYNWSIKNGYKIGLSIDRINNNKNYNSENCRFTTTKINSQNQRRSRIWTVDGRRFSSSLDASKYNNVSKVTLQRWCKGYFSNTKNKYYEPKGGCYVENRYK